MTKQRKLAYLAIIGNVIIWGAALPIVKPALSLITPFQFLFLRYALAALVLLPFLIAVITKTKITFKLIATIIVIEFIQVALGHTLLYKGLELTSAIEASLITTTAPILVTLGGIILLKENEERNEWLGLIIGVIGSLIVIISPLWNSEISFSNSFLGNILVMCYNLTWVAYVLLAKKHYNNTNKILITAISAIVGVVFYAPLLITSGNITEVLPSFKLLPVLTAVFYMGILGSPIAVALYLYGVKRIEASEATLFRYLQPLVYLPLAVLWLKETVTTAQIVGLIIIVIGVIIAERRTPLNKKATSLSA